MNAPDRDFEEHFYSEAWADTADSICRENGVEFFRLERVLSSDHVVFLIEDRLVLKIFRPSRNCFEREIKALEFTHGRLPFETPHVIRAGRFEGLDYLLTTQVPGHSLTRAEFLNLPCSEQLNLIAQLAAGLRRIHEIDPLLFADDWPAFIDDRAETFIERQIGHGVDPKVVEALPAFLETNLPRTPRTPTAFLHGDVHFGNLKFERVRGELRISGLFDFADSRRGFFEYDLLAVGILMIQGERELQRAFFTAYGYRDNELTEGMRDRLMMLTMLYETSDLRRYATRLSPESVDLSLDELKRAIWSFV